MIYSTEQEANCSHNMGICVPKSILARKEISPNYLHLNSQRWQYRHHVEYVGYQKTEFTHFFKNIATLLWIVVSLRPLSMLFSTAWTPIFLSFLRYVHYHRRSSKLRGQSSKDFLCSTSVKLQATVGFRLKMIANEDILPITDDSRPILHSTHPRFYALSRKLPCFLYRIPEGNIIVVAALHQKVNC